MPLTFPYQFVGLNQVILLDLMTGRIVCVRNHGLKCLQ